MNNASLILQRPTPRPDSLVLLLHGVGSGPADLAPLGRFLSVSNPPAFIVSLAAPEPGDLGGGYQWFSVRGISEDNRPARVARALPRLAEAVAHWQAVSGVDRQNTSMVGFSQGAIMALGSAEHTPPPSACVVAVAGRFATLPQRPLAVRVRLIHGDSDLVMPFSHAMQAEQRLKALGSDVALDLVPQLGHAMDERVFRLVAKHLRLVQSVPPRSA